MNILLVFSNAQIAAQISSLCTSLGFEIESVTQTDAAYKYCQDQLIDLVCLEPQLHDGNGFELAERFGQLESMRSCPILMICEDVHQHIIEKAFSMGVTEVFDVLQMDQLAAVLKRYVTSRELISGSVLFVEDSIAQQRIGTSVLKSMGLKVVTASDVESAWYYFQQQEFDLAIIDIVLEGDVSGIELVHRICRESNDDIPIIVMSAYDDSARRLQLNRLGVEFLNKPIVYEELTVRVRRLIELRHNHLEIERSRQVLMDKNKALEQFLGRISHECRNAINVSLAVTGRLLNNGEFSDREKEQMEMIVHSSEHLLALVNDIIDYSKIESGELKLNEFGYSPKELILRVARLFELRCLDKGLSLLVNTKDLKIDKAFGDEKKISQVLINLLGNAVKFTEEGEVEIGVSVHEVSDGYSEELEYWVRDTGPGIESEEMLKLFNVFGQTRIGKTMNEGAGLGLAISAELADMMSGRMMLTSEEGVGSRFSLLLSMNLEARAID